MRFQVIVVGGGPVGHGLAIELGRRGIRCALVERRLEPQRIPKGQNLTQRTLEHFARWGSADELRARRTLPDGYPIGGIVCYGDLMSPYWHAPAGREAVGAYFAERNERLPQYETEAVLRQRLAEVPAVTAFYGWSATGITADDDSARVTLTGAGPSETTTLEADYVVGCDGARSLVRSQCAISRATGELSQKMVLAVLRSKELHDRLSRFPERTTYRAMHPDLRGYWRFFGRIDVGEGFFFHAPVPDDATEADLDAPGLLAEAAGFPFACELDHVGLWDLRIEVADTYRRGRAFIAGDACHSHPPYGGYGLNTGMEDAVNLAWKLWAVLEGWGGEALLDSYSAERQPIFAETGEDVIAEGIRRDRAFLETYRPEVDRAAFEAAWDEKMTVADTGPQWYEPHYEGSPVVAGPPGGRCGVRGGYRFTARPGHHLAPRRRSDQSSTFAGLGDGFTLLAIGADPAGPARFADAARSLGVPLEVLADAGGGELADYGSRLVLVRPDEHVAWVGDVVPEDPRGLLEQVAGR